ncbi:hypothetical protein BC834DRAFT_974650 [Gloeopeniophorella convolvens]|nr:hypothetical protein BC834DRAFT_974650 [Gloeopeniophorella convolvens]
MVASSSSIHPISIAFPVPTFAFQPVNEMFTCGVTSVNWVYTGPQATLSLNISNVNVTQEAPPLPSSFVPSIGTPITTGGPALSTTRGVQPGRAPPHRRQFNGFNSSYLPTVNEVVAEQFDPTVGKWTWGDPGVNVPQGWYQMLADIQGTVMSSSPFFVQNGTITSCVQQFAPAVPSSAVPSQAGVAGGIAFLAAVLGALLFWLCRRRPARVHTAETGHSGRWTATPAALKRSRRASDAKPSLQKHSAGRSQTSVASDAGRSTLGHEKRVMAGAPVFLPLAQTQSCAV